MVCPRPAHWPIWLVLLIAPAPGCQSLYCYKPVAVLVKDAESSQPIADAKVTISYPLAPPGRSPYDWVGTTGSDGIARLQAAAPSGEFAIRADVHAQGYLSEEKYLNVEMVRAVEPAHLLEDVERRPVTFVLEMYAEPAPTVELVLPAGVRGMIKVDVQVREDAPCPPGQRHFSYPVPPARVVQITAPPLVRRVLPATFTARFADGTPLIQDSPEAALGFWWLKHDGGLEYFFVGTPAEWQRFSATDKDEAPERRSHDSGSGQGGRRNKRSSSGSSWPGGQP